MDGERKRTKKEKKSYDLKGSTPSRNEKNFGLQGSVAFEGEVLVRVFANSAPIPFCILEGGKEMGAQGGGKVDKIKRKKGCGKLLDPRGGKVNTASHTASELSRSAKMEGKETKKEKGGLVRKPTNRQKL